MTLFRNSIRARLLASLALGVVGAVLVSTVSSADVGAMAGWAIAAGTFALSTWLLVFRVDAVGTRLHARNNDPGRGIDDTLLVLASLASVAGLVLLLVRAKDEQQIPSAIVGVLGIVASWAAIHTLFTLRYAHAYYVEDAGGIDFNGDTSPDYVDFAYVAFTLGMTYQVSDTDLSSKTMRRMALNQALISYLLGTVIVASTINMLIQLVTG